MGRILALDIGSRRVGVAVSDSQRRMASTLKTLERQDYQQMLHRIGKYIEEYGVDLLVVGIPLDSRDGSFTPKAMEIGAEARQLQERFAVPVIGVDERFSTSKSNDFLIGVADLSRKKRKKVVDTMAAQNILQGYLDDPAKGIELADVPLPAQ
ncbi:Holliday junction resolvase RuvX [Desulfurispirillum indicum]|uniref:Putative pre-16S rRNA nuclease n=1 Tax=Desulfurispirillum indicum (strain ATCC BAA-1389 / DSM 22839 / S5) TaxID=653733 RepID=E6W0H3_DESIS|nr:Holliday junction resolvase RuvX [Desulfurispirillum indicum]ADU65225.1 Holliday junction resolvase YqgF [Desulfurispirillum indicum S5]UCZ57115.1 Holliday junction resolvase RuvX [Desulfurispirillum indicum]